MFSSGRTSHSPSNLGQDEWTVDHAELTATQTKSFLISPTIGIEYRGLRAVDRARQRL